MILINKKGDNIAIAAFLFGSYSDLKKTKLSF